MTSKISKTNFFDLFMLLIVFLSTCELLYNRTGISGKYSFYVSLIICFCSFLFIILKNNGVIKFNLWYIVAIFPILLYKFNRESIRYCLFFLTVFSINQFKIENLSKFFKILIFISGTTRVSGYMISPTIFSCTICIAMLYLLFEKKCGTSNIFFSIVGLILIYLSESSSSFIFAIFLLSYKLLINIFINRKKNTTENKKRLIIKIILLFIILASIFIILHLNDVLSIISRNNRGDSTNTRLTYYMIFIKQLISNPLMIIFGKGAGYTQQYIHSLTTIVASHYPLHQDLLMLVCEYGMVGIIYIYNVYMKKIKVNWLVWLLILLCSFHNLVLTSSTMCLIILANNSLRIQYSEIDNLWR